MAFSKYAQISYALITDHYGLGQKWLLLDEEKGLKMRKETCGGRHILIDEK